MFTKLLKHEIKSQWGTFTVLSLATLGASILGAMLTALTLFQLDVKSDATLFASITLITAPLQVFSTIFLVVYIPIIWFLLVNRFYKHHFCDEGYLTFTLPASTHKILLSNLLNTALWLILSFVVIAISGAIQQLPSDIYYDNLGDTIFLPSETQPDEVIYDILMFISQGAYALILPTLSITIGALVAKKHKLLAAFGIGYGINTAVSVVVSIIAFIGYTYEDIINSSLNSDYAYSAFHFYSILIFVVYLGIAIGGYFLMHHLIDKKLNLP